MTIAVPMAVIVLFILFALVLFFWVLLHMLMVVMVGVIRIQSDAHVSAQAGNRDMSWK